MFAAVTNQVQTMSKNQYELMMAGCAILGFIALVLVLWILWLLFKVAVKLAARDLESLIDRERDRRWEDDKELDKRIADLETRAKSTKVNDRLDLLEDLIKERRTPHDKPKDI